MSERANRVQKPIVKQGWGAGTKGVQPPQVGMAQANMAKANN